jgi:hypothetical protein
MPLYPTDSIIEQGGGTNNPDLSSNLTPRVRAVKDASQAFSLATGLQNENRDRNQKNARITAKHNSERPFRKSELDEFGLGWKQNFSTKPLGMIAGKATSRLTQAIHSLRYFTNAALPSTRANATAKTDAFRQAITSTIRSWPLWIDFLEEVALENVLFGYTSSVWLDPYSWKPEHFRQDRFFVPKDSKHYSNTASVVVVREDYKPYDLFNLIYDRSDATSAGWDINNCIDAINNAMPDTLRSTSSESERVYEDLIREVNTTSSYIGAQEIPCYSVLATEIDGKVTHWRVNAVTGKELFYREDKYDRMTDVAHFWSYDRGNGILHGSKGIGREVYAIASTIDRARNDAVDRFFLSGKYIIQGDEKQLRRLKLQIQGNMIQIGSAYTLAKNELQLNAVDYVQLDNFLRGIVDEIVGNVSPRHLQGERVTKAQVDLFAAREEESKDNVIARWMTQAAAFFSAIQRKLCDPDTKDEDAKSMQEGLLKIMTREEINELAKQPAAEVIKDYTTIEQQQIAIVCTEARGNPLYNQRAVEEQKVTALLGEDFVKKVLLPENDPTMQSEQIRQQMVELQLILLTGSPVPVSPRDNHSIHGDYLRTELDTVRGNIKTVGEVNKVRQIVRHGRDHVAAMMQAKDKAATSYAAYYQNYEQELQFIEQQLAQQQQAGGVPRGTVDMVGAVSPPLPPEGMLPPQEPQISPPTAPPIV